MAYYHVGYLTSRDLGITYEAPLQAMGNIGVDFFFVLSGFIITWIHAEDIGKPARLKSYACKRFLRIYPLMWLVILPKIIVGLVFPSMLRSLEITLPLVAASLLLFPYDHYVVMVQWTLVYEVLFYLIFAAGILAGRRVAVAGVVLWLALILSVTPPADNLLLGYLLSSRNIEFIGGGAIGYVMSRSWFLPAKWAFLLLVSSLGAFGMLLYLGRIDPLPLTLAFGGLVVAAVSLDASGAIRWPRWLVYLGDASYSIYLVHVTVQMILFVIGMKMGIPFGAYGQFFLHLLGGASVVAGILCYQWVEKPMLGLGRKWLKARNLG